MYIDINYKKPNKGQLCLCKCPNWCELGLQVAVFDGNIFDFPESPNYSFNDTVEEYLPLDKDGEPI